MNVLDHRRGQTRLRAAIPLIAFSSGRAVEGITFEVSRQGAGLELRRAVDDAVVHRVLLFRSDGRSTTLKVRVAWQRRIQGGAEIGVHFENPSVEQLRTLRDLALWDVVPERGRLILRLHGELSLHTDFGALAGLVADTAAIDFGDIDRVDAGGVLQWVDFVAGLPSGIDLRLRDVPPRLLAAIRASTCASRCIVDSARSAQDVPRVIKYRCGGGA